MELGELEGDEGVDSWQYGSGTMSSEDLMPAADLEAILRDLGSTSSYSRCFCL